MPSLNDSSRESFRVFSVKISSFQTPADLSDQITSRFYTLGSLFPAHGQEITPCRPSSSRLTLGIHLPSFVGNPLLNSLGIVILVRI